MHLPGIWVTRRAALACGLASAHGWSVLGIGTDGNGWPTDRSVHRCDADGLCDLVADAIFVDGFDAAGDG